MNELINRRIDNYRIDALLGRGGMGAVYRAHDLNLDRDVAFKVIKNDSAGDPDYQRRFKREAQAIANLEHPSIVKIYDFDKYKELLYMVMEYVPGGSLESYLSQLHKSGSIITLREMLFLLAQVTDALGYAHKKGVIHRDIKPSNVLVKKLERPARKEEPSLRAVVADFGLVKLLTNSDESQTGHPVGTYKYMSPEQCLNKSVDARTDIYSLGVMLYQLTTGKLPLDIQSATDAVLKHQRKETPPAPSSLRPGLPPTVEAVILKAIERKSKDRFQTAEALAHRLREATNALTEAEITEFTGPGTALSVFTHLQREIPSSIPSDQGQKLPPASYGDRLVIAQKEHTARSVPLDRALLTLGRSRENEVPLPHEDVSRQHARLERIGNGWQVVDLGSTNGTYLEGARLLPDVPEAFEIGQTLRIGPFFIHWQRAGTAVSPSEHSYKVPSRGALSSGMTRVHSSSGQISVDVNPTNLELAPGERAEVQVNLFNQGVTVDHFSLHIEDLPGSWVTLSKEAVELMPEGEASLPLTIHPPRDSSARAGAHPYRLVISSIDNPRETANVQVNLTIKPFEDFKIDIKPSYLVNGGISQVTIHNQGNDQGIYNIKGHDPAEAIRFDGAHNDIRIVPGRQKTLELRVAAKKRPWLGLSKTRPFEVRVESATGADRKKPGQLEVHPIIPTWLLTILGLLLVAGSFIIPILFQNGESSIPSPVTSSITLTVPPSTPTSTLTVQPVPPTLNWVFIGGHVVIDPEGKYWEKYEDDRTLPGIYLRLKDLASVSESLRDYLELKPDGTFDIEEGGSLSSGTWQELDENKIMLNLP